MRYLDVPQGSREWLQARCGIPTSSEFDRILTPKTLQLSKASEKYMHQKLAEWMTGTPFSEEVRIWSTAMEDGIEREQQSVDYYELVSGKTTTLAGFCLSDCGRYGSSPDRFIGDREAILEVKNPTAGIHVGWLLGNKIPDEHLLQCQGQLFVTGLPRHVFLSYFPGLPALIVESRPLPDYQDALANALEDFSSRFAAAKLRLHALRGAP